MASVAHHPVVEAVDTIHMRTDVEDTLATAAAAAAAEMTATALAMMVGASDQTTAAPDTAMIAATAHQAMQDVAMTMALVESIVMLRQVVMTDMARGMIIAPAIILRARVEAHVATETRPQGTLMDLETVTTPKTIGTRVVEMVH